MQMRFRLFRLTGFCWPPGWCPGYRSAGALATGAVVAGLAAVGLPAAAQTASRQVVSVTPVRGAAAMTVPLVTGDQVMVTMGVGGRPSYVVRPAAGSVGAAELYQTQAGEQFVIPAVALPYVGKELGRSLFDVSALVRDGITGARVPVRLTFAPGVTPAAPPGVTLTWIGGRFARGYLTASSGRLLAAALSRQTGADVVAGHLARADRLFGGLAAMNLDAPGAPMTVRPHFPLRILQFDVRDETGKPANNVAVRLVNTDDVTREAADVPVSDGVGRVAVPAGDYSAVAFFIDSTPPKNIAAFRFVTLADFRVPAASGMTKVPIRERSATSPVSVTTPRPATADLLDFGLLRFDAARGRPFSSGVTLFSLPGTAEPPLYVNAQPAAKVGRLRYVLQWDGEAVVVKDAYRYDVAFGADNIPADEHFVVRPEQIATVRQHYFADPVSGSATGQLLNGAIDPVAAPFIPAWDTGTGGLDERMPGDLTQYLGTADGGQWVQSVFTANGTYLTADRRTFIAGRRYSVAWAHGPLAAGFGQHRGLPAPVADPRSYPWNCLACAAGRTLSVVVSPVGDSQLDHGGEAIGPAGYHFTLYRDRTRLFHGGAVGAVLRGIPAVAGTYRAVLDVSSAGVPGFSQSTHTRTDLRVPYSPAADPGAALPAGDSCAGQSAAAPCRILPALTLNYLLAANESNTSTARVQVMQLSVAHVSYDGAGSGAPVTSAAVWVSFDGGRSWQRATVTGSGGRYTATWRNPASARGTDPAIKVTARDALGGSITQTITRAYTIGTASQNGSTR
jgi:hypothetical protein